jgi:hypothetical protein
MVSCSESYLGEDGMCAAETALRQDESVQDAIKLLFLGCAPEREAELRQLWETLNPLFQVAGEIHEGDRFIFDAGAYRYVRFNHRAVRAFWLGSFAAWEGYRAIADNIDSFNFDFSRMAGLIAAFEQVLISDQPDLEPLAEGVPEPGQLPDATKDAQGRAAAELAIFAVGWALLHEVKHLQHQQAGTGTDLHGVDEKLFHKEELSCDAFATNFLLERAADFSASSSSDLSKVRQKRELGIYFSFFILTLLAKDRWGATKTHPAIQDRIDAVCSLMRTTHSEVAEAIAHTAFAALRTLWENAPGVLFRGQERVNEQTDGSEGSRQFDREPDTIT